MLAKTDIGHFDWYTCLLACICLTMCAYIDEHACMCACVYTCKYIHMYCIHTYTFQCPDLQSPVYTVTTTCYYLVQLIHFNDPNNMNENKNGRCSNLSVQCI